LESCRIIPEECNRLLEALRMSVRRHSSRRKSADSPHLLRADLYAALRRLQQARKDLEMFQQITERYRALGPLLADLALEPANESVSDITATGTDDEKLVLSTIHSAKGLEWHTVFVLYALDGRFPHARAAMTDDAMEEERRLMYVACTRAQQNLFITYPINIYDRESGMSCRSRPGSSQDYRKTFWKHGCRRRVSSSSIFCFDGFPCDSFVASPRRLDIPPIPCRF